MLIALSSKNNILISLIGLFSFSYPLFAELSLTGTLKELGTRNPLSGVTIYVLPHKLKAETDEKGNFQIDNVPEGEFQWVVNFSGYKKLEKNDSQKLSDKNSFRILRLERLSYDTYETTIYGKEDKRDDKTQSLTAKQLQKLPGSGGDAVKAVQNLTGVNRANSFSSQIIIEGSAPQDTKYNIDGHEVPLIFHFGGLSSVVSSDALDRVDYLPAGYGPEYGRALGGIVGVTLRAPKRDRWHGLGFVDLLNAGLLTEGPIDEKSAVLLSFRQSYIGYVMNAVLKNNKDFDLAVAPSYSDATVVYDTNSSASNNFRLVSTGSLDTLKFLFDSPVSNDNSARGSFSYKTSFFRIIPEYTHTMEDGSIRKISLGVGKDWIRYELTNDFLDISTTNASLRAEVEHKWFKEWTSYFGTDSKYALAEIDYLLPGSSTSARPSSTSVAKAKVTAQQTAYNLGFYWRNKIIFENSPYTFLPSLRGDYFNRTGEFFISPRGALRYALSESLMARFSSGFYVQPPEGIETDISIGNPDLTSPSAIHFSLGAEKDFREGESNGIVTSVDFFYKHFSNLVIPSKELITRNGVLTRENNSNRGTGKAYGIETMIRLQKKPWSGWLTYTLSRSERTEPDNGTHLFRYDQTHILTAILQVDLPSNWTISTRFRYTSGNPYTPYTSSVFDSDSSSYLPVSGPIYTVRLSPFYSLDVRVDKKWILSSFILSAYLDIQNVTNHKNEESLVYSYDYSQNKSISLLPILPTIGLKGEF